MTPTSHATQTAACDEDAALHSQRETPQDQDAASQSQDETSQEQGSAKRKRSRGKKNKELGQRGEDAAARYLHKRGYDIIARNWTCFAGEADIIARDGDALVFVEVKTRTDCQKGFPAEAVTPVKRGKYEKIALAFLADYEVADISVRFDVVSIVVVAHDRALIRHHIGAYTEA